MAPTTIGQKVWLILTGSSSACRCGRASGVPKSLTRLTLRAYVGAVDKLREYQKAALKRAVVKYLGTGEGYSAKIPGFAGLIVFGDSKREVLAELESAF